MSRPEAAAYLLWLALAATAAGVALRAAGEKLRRLFGCGVPGCVVCGGQWRDSEVGT